MVVSWHPRQVENSLIRTVDGSRGTSGGYGSSGAGGAGYGSTTAGPHSSDLANKADPRIDSDQGRI
jgi:hypothetical protein